MFPAQVKCALKDNQIKALEEQLATAEKKLEVIKAFFLKAYTIWCKAI